MEPNSEKKFYGLDHLRALAILQVFLFHYYLLVDVKGEWVHRLAKFGWSGVDLFFVLSGFLISSQLFAQVRQEKKISYYEFFIKRSFRIQPAFWFITAIYFLFPVFREAHALPPLWKFLTFTQNIGLNSKDFGAFSHAWSLCVEEHFYFFIPVVLIILQYFKLTEKSLWLVLALFIVSFILRIYSYSHYYLPKEANEFASMYWFKYIYYPTYNRLDSLITGVTIAFVYQYYPGFWKRITRYGNYFFALSVLILTGAFILFRDQDSFGTTVFGFPVVALGYGFLVLGAVSPSSFLYKWNSKTTTFFATISYSIYLSHKVIIHLTTTYLTNRRVEGYLVLLICILTCTIGAVLLNQAIEKPFMRLRRKFIAVK